MTSFIRISDVPPDELYLLPIIGLRQQIREDRSRPSSPDNAASERQTKDALLDPAQHPVAAPRKESPAAVGRFVTEWQQQDEPRPSALFRFNRDGHDDEDHDDEGLDDEDHNPGETFDDLYVDLGGEG